MFMSKYIYLLIVIVAFSSHLHIYAFVEEKDSVKLDVKAWNILPHFSKVDSVSFDTSMSRLNNYYLSQYPYNSIYPGVEGYPIYDFVSKPEITKPNYLNRGLHAYNFSFSNTKFYNVSKPLTELSYYNGGPKSAKYQRINVLHTQNFSDKLNLGFRFNNISNVGNYLRQEARDYNFNFWSALRLNKYSAYATISLNRYKNQESGGIVTASSFEEDNGQKDLFIPVWLNSAKSVNRFKEFSVLQYFHLEEHDSLTRRFVHHITYEGSNRAFSDDGTDSSYYQLFEIDSVVSYDSLIYYNISNNFGYEVKKTKEYGTLLYQVGLHHQYYHFYHVDNASDNSLAIRANSGLYKDNWKANLSLSYTAFGYNAGSTELLGDWIMSLADTTSSNIKISLSHKSKDPDWFYYNSSLANNISVQPTDKESRTFIDGNYFNFERKLELKVCWGLLGNPIYFSESAILSQKEGIYEYFSIGVNKAFSFGRFTMMNNLSFQHVYSTRHFPLPKYYYKGSLYYENTILDNVLNFQIGVDGWITSKFNAPGYMPVYGAYYPQNEKLIGAYPTFDVYAKFKLKTVRILIKYEHFNEGLLGREYYGAYLYPLNPARLTWGLVWFFYD